MFGFGNTTPRVQVRNDKDGGLFTLGPEMLSQSFRQYAANVVMNSQRTTTTTEEAPISPPPARWFGPVAALVAAGLVVGVGVIIVRRSRK